MFRLALFCLVTVALLVAASSTAEEKNDQALAEFLKLIGLSTRSEPLTKSEKGSPIATTSSSVKGWPAADKEFLLAQLWENQVPAAFFAMNGLAPPPLNYTEVSETIEQGKYVDYLCGRAIKIDVSKDVWDFTTYDTYLPKGYLKGEDVYLVVRWAIKYSGI